MNDQQIIEELVRVTESDSFRSRKQMRRFLSYVVTETLEGRSTHIKQYTIAVYGLGKPDDFSPDENPLVRVEAGRLRGLLSDYYNNKGKDNAIKINLPKGSYQPEFLENIITQKANNGKKTYRTHNLPKVYSDSIKVLLGFKCFSPSPENLDLYYVIVRDFTLILNKFPLIKMLSASPNNSNTLAGHDYLNHIRKKYQADFLLKMDVECLNQRLNLKCLLLHTVTEEVVWVDSFDIEDQRESRKFDTIYSKVANDLFSPNNGIAHQYRGQYLQEFPSGEGTEHQLALLHLYNTYLSLSSHDRHVALDFCKYRLIQQPHDTVAIFVNLHLCVQEYLLGNQVIEGLNEQFYGLVTSALRLDPDNAETHLFHAFAAYLQQDIELSCTALANALAINPYSAFNQIFAGGLFFILGRFELSDGCIDQAISMSSRYPDWYHILTCLRACHKDDLQGALEEAKKIYIPCGNILRAYFYHKMGMKTAAQRELNTTNKGQCFLSLEGSWLSGKTLKTPLFLSNLLSEIAEIQAQNTTAA